MSFWDKLKAAFGDQVEIIEDTQLEQYCRKNYTQVPRIAYSNKRSIQDNSYSIYLNELITPRAFEVDKLFRGVYPTGTNKVIAKAVGDKVAKTLKWTDDINLANSGDYYLYPNEAIANRLCDCEDHAYVVASCNRELGVAYGFLGGTGHAFNVFVEDNKLYVLDTVGNSARIEEYQPNSNYSIHYIITQRYTFLLKKGVSFGEIAQW